MKHLGHVLALAIVFAPISTRADETLTTVWTVDTGFSEPESACYDPASQAIYVSNIGGKPAEKDGNGWISKLGADGKMIESQWVKGLNAPKGLGIVDGMLWVADIDKVVGIDIASGEIKEHVKTDGAKFLNDVTIGNDGDVYVSDMFANKIFRVADGKASVLADGESLSFPNGILFHDGKIVIASRADQLNTTDFTSKGPAHLLSLDLETKEIAPITKQPLGYLDGVALDGSGGYFVTDLVGGKLYRITSDGEAVLLLEGLNKPADLGVISSQQLLIVPELPAGKVTAYKLSE